jgi:hypothetical protein
VVALRTTCHEGFTGKTPADLATSSREMLPGLGTNGRSIAESVGMPKETVRRKIQDLLEAGWLVRDGTMLYATAKCYVDMAPVREQIERQAARNHHVIETLLRARADGQR